MCIFLTAFKLFPIGVLLDSDAKSFLITAAKIVTHDDACLTPHHPLTPDIKAKQFFHQRSRDRSFCSSGRAGCSRSNSMLQISFEWYLGHIPGSGLVRVFFQYGAN